MFGYDVYKDPRLVDRTQKRKHRKKRINKKWLKKYGFIETPQKKIYIFNNKIIGHPVTINKIMEQVKTIKSGNSIEAPSVLGMTCWGLPLLKQTPDLYFRTNMC